mmetsp:Transcript_61035/g.108522  ORF Transcript_61035/g.108522 Transcript_61035/m.108522 type:complete len:259 (+) Transcript_61035:1329-2105(+)
MCLASWFRHEAAVHNLLDSRIFPGVFRHREQLHHVNKGRMLAKDHHWHITLQNHLSFHLCGCPEHEGLTFGLHWRKLRIIQGASRRLVTDDSCTDHAYREGSNHLERSSGQKHRGILVWRIGIGKPCDANVGFPLTSCAFLCDLPVGIGFQRLWIEHLMASVRTALLKPTCTLLMHYNATLPMALPINRLVNRRYLRVLVFAINGYNDVSGAADHENIIVIRSLPLGSGVFLHNYATGFSRLHSADLHRAISSCGVEL